MKKISILLIFALAVFSCSKDDSDEETKNDKPVLKLIVYNAEDWTPENTMPVATSATVEIFNGHMSNEFTTNNQGCIYTDELAEDNSYTIKVDKGDLSNLLEQEIINDQVVGYLTDGIFQTQEEVDSRASYQEGQNIYYAQTDVKVGDLRLVDVNNDIVISSYDKTYGMPYTFEPYIDVNGDMVIDEMDKVDGEYVLADTVEVDIWIGR